jgi:short-subunit dehydrogenase
MHRLGDDDGAAGAQRARQRRLVRRHQRANASAPPVVGMSVVWMLSLSAIGMPCSGPAQLAGLALGVARVGLRERARVDGDGGVETALVAGDTIERLLDERMRGDAALLERRAHVADAGLDDRERRGFSGAGRAGWAATTASDVRISPQAMSRRMIGRYHEAVSARRLVLVTGASSGIGAACAEVFAANGFDVAITARREAKLQTVAAGLRERHGAAVHVFTVDHADPASAARLCEELAARGLTVDALVNNAGYGVPGLYNAVPWQVHEDFLRVMVAGVCELTYRLMPGMIERGYGRIVNVASLAGLVPAPAGHALYGASKAFLIKMSEALAHEGRPHGVSRDGALPRLHPQRVPRRHRHPRADEGMPSWMWLDAATVAQQGYDAVMAGEPMRITAASTRPWRSRAHVPQWLVRIGQRADGRRATGRPKP